MTSIVERLAGRRCVTAQSLAGVACAPLDELAARRVTTVLGFDADDAVTRRLFDLGFAPGTSVELIRRAPLRDPLMFRVGGCELVLRRREARRILVAA